MLGPMRPPAFLPVSALVLLVASGVACSTILVPDGGQTSGGGASPAPSGTTTPLPSGLPGAPPTCALTIDGAVVLDIPDATPTAMLYGLSEVDVQCAFTRGDIAYDFFLVLDGLDGPATYTAPQVRLGRYCLASSCPGAFDFSAYAPAPTCSITLDTFAPAARGGMSGSFSCSQLLIDDFLDESDVAAVAIQGAFAFPPPGEAEVADAGAGADAGPPTCTMTVSAPFDPGTMAGDGYEINGMATCIASGGGATFSLQQGLDGAMASGQLRVDGASFCSAGCGEVYVPTAPCDVHVLDDQGVNGHFAAQVVCHGMALDGSGAGGGNVDVIANIDGVHEPTPPPG
jgi:hypothetical protein